MTPQNPKLQDCPVCGRPLSSMEYEYIASETPGVMTLPIKGRRQTLANASRSIREKGPGLIPVLIGGVGRYIWGFLRGLLAPYKFLPGYLLGGLWLLLSLLWERGVTYPLDDVLLWITYSTAGLEGGGLDILGGIIGKGIYAAALFRIIAKWDVGPVKKEKIWVPGTYGAGLAGLGLSWMLFNFFTWDNDPQRSVIGLILALGLIKAMTNPRSYMSALVRSFWRELDFVQGKAMGWGLVAGFLTAVPGSLIAGSRTGYFIGFPLFLIGLLMGKSKLAERLRSKYLGLLLLFFWASVPEYVAAAVENALADPSLLQVLIVGIFSSLAAAAATSTVLGPKGEWEKEPTRTDPEPEGQRIQLYKNFGDSFRLGAENQLLEIGVENLQEDGTWKSCSLSEGQLSLYLSKTVPGLRLEPVEGDGAAKRIWKVILDRSWPEEHGVITCKWEQGNATSYCRVLFHLKDKI